MYANTAQRISEPGLVRSTFVVQIFAYDGRLLSEYSLSGANHKLNSLADAEALALDNLNGFFGEQVVLVVSEETLTKLRQVQRKAAPRMDSGDTDLVQPASAEAHSC